MSGAACMDIAAVLSYGWPCASNPGITFAFRRSDGSTFSLSLGAVIGFVAIPLGLILIAAGFVLLRRAIAKARANPVTPGVIGEALSGRTERWFT